MDRIEKSILLRAPRERVWRAISMAEQFGTWFGVELSGEFSAGARLAGRIVPTKVDAEVAKTQEPYTGMTSEWVVEQVEPMRLLSFRWHPGPVEPGADPASEPMTLVVFQLEEAEGGTRLTITESGFDQLPPERRAKVFEGNSEGWAIQTSLIEKYLARNP